MMVSMRSWLAFIDILLAYGALFVTVDEAQNGNTLGLPIIGALLIVVLVANAVLLFRRWED